MKVQVGNWDVSLAQSIIIAALIVGFALVLVWGPEDLQRQLEAGALALLGIVASVMRPLLQRRLEDAVRDAEEDATPDG